MASTKELKTRIGSVEDTMKITNAMYMIANNKMRKAKKAREATEPYGASRRYQSKSLWGCSGRG